MKSKAYTSQKGNRTPAIYISIGICAALLTSILISVGLTSLVAKGTLQIDNLQFIVFVTRAISVMLGAVITTVLHKGNALVDIGIVSLGYFVALMAACIIAYEGTFLNLGGGLLSVLSGGAAACLIRLKPPKRKKLNRRYTK